MWLLRNDSKGLIYRVTCGKQHVVTRKDGDLLLLGDQSISRKHALLEVDEENGRDGIVIKDLGSKYGTFTVIGNGEIVQLQSNQQTKLQSGDSVKFGIQWNLWRAEFVHLLVTNSTLTVEEKSEVKQMVESLGGQVTNDWQAECSHLTMNKITVTIKVVCALATGQPIVTPSYWQAFSQSLTKMETTLPDYKDYLPPLAEAMLNPSEVSFFPKPERSKLFQGYIFIAASTKQLGRIKPMIAAAGGKAVEFSAKMWNEEKLLQDKIILMSSSANDRQGSQQSQVIDGYMPLARKLKSKGVRCIPESEIGLSVLYCSLSQYCNPRFITQNLLNNSSSGQATQHVTIICPNTEDAMLVDQDNVDTVPAPSKKRALESTNGDHEPISKRPDLREHSEDLFGSQPENNSKTNISSVLSIKKTSFLNKSQQEQIRVNHVPSLDMFASSGSGSSNLQKENAIPNISCEDMFASTGSGQDSKNIVLNKSQQKPIKVNHVPSLDMFASSGSGSSNLQKENAIQNISCEDIFASTGSRQDSKNIVSDEFSFRQGKNTVETVDGVNKKDEFSFSSSKNKKKSETKPENSADLFSFKSNKSSNISLQSDEVEDDAFSFTSTKRPNKRNRQSNEDMFASSTESSVVNEPMPGPSKDVGFFSFKRSKPNEIEDNLFAFPDDHNPKRRRTNDELLDNDKTTSDIKLALFAERHDSEPQVIGIQQDLDDSSEPKNLITYSKQNPKVKKEIQIDEVDALAEDLCNATIVIIKPLVVAKEKPIQCSAPTGGKNFKKFKKVVGLNKRIIPHIIGGNDLVPHYNMATTLEKDEPSRDGDVFNVDDEDEWAFGRNKASKRIR